MSKKRIFVSAIVCIAVLATSILLNIPRSSAATSVTVEDNSVVFSIEYTDAKEAFVAGSFNKWELMPLKRQSDKWVSEKITLTPGVYEYKYVIKLWSGEMIWLDANYNKSGSNSFFCVGNIIAGAFIDLEEINSKKVAVAKGVYPPNIAKGSLFKIYMDGKEIASGNASSTSDKIRIELPSNFVYNPDSIYEIRDSQNKLEPTVLIPRTILNEFMYNGNDLGLSFSSSNVTFKVWSPFASDMKVCVYSKNNSPEDSFIKEYNMTKDKKTGVWSVSLYRDEVENKYYLYKATFFKGKAKGYEKPFYAVDPYAYAVGTNGKKGAIIDINDYNKTNSNENTDIAPTEWEDDKFVVLDSPENSVLYEMHIKDFSLDPNSNIPNEYAGKYKALTVTGTTLKEDPSISTGIDHLSELGINTVHIMPAYDFASVDESEFLPYAKKTEAVEPILKKDIGKTYNWGYDPQNFNVPEGSYSLDPSEPKSRVKEFREMVQALHKKGIRVVMDVVYNHVYDADTNPLNILVPKYYFRTDDYGLFTNGSGCGNEIATERPMVGKFITDSVKHWMNDYHVDGFRFDLLGLYDINTFSNIVKEIRQINPNAIIYGEPWTGGKSALPEELQVKKGTQKNKNFSVFNDVFRNALRGENKEKDTPKAYITDLCNASNKETVFKGIMGGIWGLYPDDEQNSDSTKKFQRTSDPQEIINYISCHDDYNLFDQIQSAMGNLQKTTPSDSWSVNDIDMQRAIFGAGIIFTSQGIPFFQSGDEFLRTKWGVFNTYSSPENINMLRWSGKKNNYKVFEYYKGLIKLRNEHPAFRMTSSAQIKEHFQGISSSGYSIAYRLVNNANNDPWRNIVVIANPYANYISVNLPYGEHKAVVLGDRAGTDVISSFHNQIQVPPISIAVLYSE